MKMSVKWFQVIAAAVCGLVGAALSDSSAGMTDVESADTSSGVDVANIPWDDAEFLVGATNLCERPAWVASAVASGGEWTASDDLSGWWLPTTNDAVAVAFADSASVTGLSVRVRADTAAIVRGVVGGEETLQPLALHVDGDGWLTNRVVSDGGLAGVEVAPANANGAVIVHIRLTADGNGADEAIAESSDEGMANDANAGDDFSVVLRESGLLSEFAPRGEAVVDALADFDALMTEVVRVDATLSFGPTSSAWPGLPSEFKDRFQSRHTGFIRIPEDGVYSFHLVSDDGARLWLDGAPLVDNDGNHAARERSASRTLVAGDHSLRVDYYDSTSTSELTIHWTRPDGVREPVPASVLFHDVPQGELRPSVWLSNPPDGARLPRETPLVLSADAADFDGAVVEVSYLANGMRVGVGAGHGWRCTWTPAATGVCSVAACALDDSGNARTSAMARVAFSEPPAYFAHGLRSDFFELPSSRTNLPDFATMDSVASFSVPCVDFPATADAWAGFPEARVDRFGCVFSGFLDAPETGWYTLRLKSDDGSRLFVDDARVVDNDGQHGFSEKSGAIHLERGFHRLRLEYYENAGDAGLRISWSGPSFPMETVPPAALLTLADETDTDGDGLPDWWEFHNGLAPAVAQSPETDSDGDGLTDFFEFATSHTHPLRADTDGDGLPDGWEVAHGLNPMVNDALDDPDGDGLVNVDEFRAGTDPRNPDTDGDGLSDGIEVRSARSNPAVADIDGGGATNISALTSADTRVSSTGTWREEGDGSVYAAERSGSLMWNLAVPPFGADAIAVRVEQHSPFAASSDFDLELEVDGVSVGRIVVSAPRETPADALFFMPEVRSGDHAFRLVWRNDEVNTFLAVRDLRFVGFSAPDADGNGRADWLDWRDAQSWAMDAPPVSSLVSPLCVEGRDVRRDVLEALVSHSGTGEVYSVVETVGDGFYVDVPLASDGMTTVALAGLARTNEFSVEWAAFDVFAAASGTNALPIRAGDSLKVACFGDAATDIALWRAEDGAWKPLTNWTQTAATPFRFSDAGLYRVDASAPSDALSRTNASAVVSAVSSRFPERSPAVLLSGARDLECPELSQDALIEHDADLVVYAEPRGAGGVSLSLSTSVDRELGLVSRLSEDGPILDAVQVVPVRADNGTYYRVLEMYSDGSQLTEVVLSLGAFLQGLSVELEIFASGVSFEDGTRTRTLTAEDFDSEGRCRVRFVKARGVVSSVCHRTRILQNGRTIYANGE